MQSLVATLVIAVLDERFDLRLEVAGQEVVFQLDGDLEGLVSYQCALISTHVPIAAARWT